MTIRLITGVPGAGKTTFGVSQVLKPLMGSKLTIEEGADAGTTVERRCIVSGVRGLLLDHQRCAHRLTGDAPPAYAIEFWNQVQATPSAEGTIYSEFVKGRKLDHLEDEPLYQRLPNTPALRRVPKNGTLARVDESLDLADDGQVNPHAQFIDVPCLVQNWWLWCRPGDTIFVDEVQFLAPRGALSKKPPLWLQLLEIHRHYGIDFVFVTQHPQLVDNVIRALVGHHEHVRSIMGTSLCTVYTWDHAANPERFTMANKRLWKRGRKDYRLFHSAAAHTSAPAAGRSIAYVLPLLVLGIGAGAYAFTARWRNPATPIAQTAGQANADQPGAPGQAASAAAAASFRVGGCWTQNATCRCILQDGRPYKPPSDDLCQVSASGFDGLVKWRPREAPVQAANAYGATAAPSVTSSVVSGALGGAAQHVGLALPQ